MLRRLTVSLVLMGLATVGLGAGVFAWFSDSGTGHVTITASDDVDLTFDVNQDCDGDVEATDTDDFDFDWSDVVPGDTTTDCITVHNLGSVDLQLSVAHLSVDGSGVGLANDIRFAYDYGVTGTDECEGPANATGYVSASGCALGPILAGDSVELEVTVTYTDSGDQNAQQGHDLTLDAVITGRTS